MTLGSPELYSATSSDAGVVEENEELRLSSLLTLFEKLGCQKHNKKYVSREDKVLSKT